MSQDSNEPVPGPKDPEGGRSVNFVRAAVEADLRTGRFGGVVATRFPPEPNGYLHIGHAKAICLNFGIASEYGGTCNLRFDDTNPVKEDVEYVDAIRRDIRWLGFDWGDRLFYASDYFEQIHDYAVHLIGSGNAYVCSLSAEEIRATRGTLTEPGTNSPHRERSVEENLRLFAEMREGKHADGAHVLRARIDMASPNINLRDPVIYRIRRATHHRTGDTWCIYPTYDFAHGLSDAIEGITHSICSLEFENHRPLYDWFLDNLPVPCHPQQIEFARLNLTHTVMSKRKLLALVKEGQVSGWDDPRMPTLAGMRRRGYPSDAIRAFCERIGVAKRDSTVDLSLLDHAVRESLNKTAPRAMAVLNPLRVVIENYPEGEEELTAINNPEDESMGTRPIPFSRELFIEREDFMEDPPKKFFRLAPGREVRLRYAYFIRCVGVEKDEATGEISTVQCTYDPATRGGDAPDGRKVKATLHWVSAPHAKSAEVRLYEPLFAEDPGGEPDLRADSQRVLSGCPVEPSLIEARPGVPVQFERLGYFAPDLEFDPGRPVFHRTATLRDTWARVQKSATGTS